MKLIAILTRACRALTTERDMRTSLMTTTALRSPDDGGAGMAVADEPRPRSNGDVYAPTRATEIDAANDAALAPSQSPAPQTPVSTPKRALGEIEADLKHALAEFELLIDDEEARIQEWMAVNAAKIRAMASADWAAVQAEKAKAISDLRDELHSGAVFLSTIAHDAIAEVEKVL